MLNASLRAAAGIGSALLFSYLLQHDAHACGGCFHPPPHPNENPSVVTDHRMILGITKQESTLWDQISYSGEPSSFAWVLPISGTVRVGLSADSIFQGLDRLTATTIHPPPENCPTSTPPRSGNGCSSTTAVQDLSAPGALREAGVEVTSHNVVGPYETVQLRATDPNALEAWLAQNGFVVPEDVKPVVDAYVAEKFDFLALRLLPGKGVNDMRPVRVTTAGPNAVLPLRMVAAGTGPVVGITLWVVAEGRYEPQNFPWFRIRDDELAWDWTHDRSDYVELRAQKTEAANGRAWNIESSTTPGAAFIQASFPDDNGSIGYAGDYLADDAAQKSGEQVRKDDLAALFAAAALGSARITRMRADLSHAALATDLVMVAAPDQSVLPADLTPEKEIGQPLCRAYSDLENLGMIPRDQAQAYADKHETFSCATGGRSRSAFWLGAGAAAMALAAARGWRRRRTRG
jgi:hypothetical protein